MPKVKGPKENFRVVVEPRTMGDIGVFSMSDNTIYHGEGSQERKERDYLDRCDEIAADIKRHVDNVRYVEVMYDQEDVCEFCGDLWTSENSNYNGCCSKDEEEEMSNA